MRSNRVDEKMADKTNDIFDEAGENSLRAVAEPSGTVEISPYENGHRKIVRNRIPEISIVKEVSQIPEVVQEIDDLSNWFPELVPEVPIAQISISSSVHSNPGYIRQRGVEIPPDGVIHQDTPFPMEYHIIEGSSQLRDKLDLPEGLQVFFTDDFSVGWFQTEFLTDIYGEVSSVGEQDVIEFYSLEPFVETWEDRVFHFDQVLQAYRQNQIGLLIVLLSVFFESYVESQLVDYLGGLTENNDISMMAQDMRFDSMLNSCRKFDLVQDSDYNIIDKVKTSRNNYAHDMNAFRVSETTQIEEEGLVEDAIELYEETIGVQNSMTN